MENKNEKKSTNDADKSQKILIIILSIILVILLIYAFVKKNNNEAENTVKEKQQTEEVEENKEKETEQAEEKLENNEQANTNSTNTPAVVTPVVVDNRVSDATKAVENADSKKTILLVNAAQELINKLDDGDKKTELQNKLDDIEEEINDTIEELENEIDKAKELIDSVPDAYASLTDLTEELQSVVDEDEEVLEDTSSVDTDELNALKNGLTLLINELTDELNKEDAISLVNEIQELITNADELADITEARTKLVDLEEKLELVPSSATKTLLTTNFENLSTRLEDVRAPIITFVDVTDDTIIVERGDNVSLPETITDEIISLPVVVAATSCVYDKDVIGDYTCTYTATDANYNSSTKNLIISVVDTTAPTATISYESSLENTKYVKTDLVKIVSLEKINIVGWTKVDDYTYTKEYTSNVTDEQVIITDLAGNILIKTITTTMIDNIAPTITGIVDDDHYTTITPVIADDKLLETITLEKDGVVVNEYDEENAITEEGNYVLTATDEAGNTKEVSFVIDVTKPTIVTEVNTDTKATTLTVFDNYTGTTDLVIEFTKAEEILTFTNGMVVTETGSYKLIVTDKAGNTNTIEFTISE